MKTIYAISIPVLLIAALVAGCSGDLTSPGSGSTYQVEALLVKNTIPDSAAIFLTLKKNSSVYKNAVVKISGMALDTNQYGYVRHFSGISFPADSGYTLNIKDDSLDVNLTIDLPGTFAINTPALRYFTGSAESVIWSTSIGSDGYILATRPPDPPDTLTVYDAYEAYIATTQGTIPPDYFLYGLDRIVGTHMIYAAAYVGAPIDFYELPFTIPDTDNPANNISSTRISGRLAGMVIAAPDSIIVVD